MKQTSMSLQTELVSQTSPLTLSHLHTQMDIPGRHTKVTLLRSIGFRFNRDKSLVLHEITI